MNESEIPETNGTEPSDADAVRQAIDRAAAQVDIGSADDQLVGVRSIATARRRRRNAAVGVAAALAVVAGGVVVANVVGDDSNGDDLIVSAPADEPASTSAESGESADVPSTEADVPASTAPVAPVDPVEDDATADAETISPAGAYAGVYQQVLPWQDGFIAIGEIYSEQALPTELPEEITAQFPDEVVQFFEDAGGLPPTINEATEMLSEAGLLDVVTDIVLNNPEVSDAIYGAPVDPPTQFARISADGREWAEVDFEFPVGAEFDRRVVSTGDRLVVVATEAAPEPPVEPGTDPATSMTYRPPTAVAVNVFSTTDLVTWTTQRVELPEITAVETDYLWTSTYLNGVAANDDGWVVSVGTYTEVDYLTLLPDDVEQNLRESQYGYGTSEDEDGIVIETYSEDGSQTSTSYTWAELGLDGRPEALAGFDGSQDMGTTWVSTWDGTPLEIVTEGYGEVIGFDGGFVRQGMDIEFSADGLTWTPVGQPVANGWTNALMALPDGGVVAFSGGPEDAQMFELDPATLTWSPLDVVDLPEGFSPWSQPSGSAVLYTVADFTAYEDEFPVEPIVDSFINETHRFDFTVEQSALTYELVDLATGEVVVSESVDSGFSSDGAPPLEYLVEEDDGGITLLSPETGEVITSFTPDQMNTSNRSEQPATTELVATEVGAEVSVEPADVDPAIAEQPPTYVLATDGTNWINQRVEPPATDGDSDMGFAYVGEATANNGVVIVTMTDGSMIRIEI